MLLFCCFLSIIIIIYHDASGMSTPLLFDGRNSIPILSSSCTRLWPCVVAVSCCSLLYRADARRYPTMARIADTVTINSNVNTSWRVPFLYSTQYRLGVSQSRLNVTTYERVERGTHQDVNGGPRMVQWQQGGEVERVCCEYHHRHYHLRDKNSPHSHIYLQIYPMAPATPFWTIILANAPSFS